MKWGRRLPNGAEMGIEPGAARPPAAHHPAHHHGPHPAPLAHLHGHKPPAPAWFEQALAMRPERQFIDVQGGRVETLAWGPRGAPGILLMHGNGAHAEWYSFIAPLLADRYRVAAVSFTAGLRMPSRSGPTKPWRRRRLVACLMPR